MNSLQYSLDFYKLKYAMVANMAAFYIENAASKHLRSLWLQFRSEHLKDLMQLGLYVDALN